MPDNISIDWLDFTVKIPEGSTYKEVVNAIKVFLNTDLFQGKGGISGYDSSLSFYETGIVAWHSLRPQMGVHVSLSGKAISDFYFWRGIQNQKVIDPSYLVTSVIDHFCMRSSSDASLSTHGLSATRIDIAFDDFSSLLSKDRIRDYTYSRSFVSNFLEGRLVEKTFTPVGKPKGWTFYYGTPSGDSSQIRIYDKAAEQMVSYPWVRCEIQFRKTIASPLLFLIYDYYIRSSESSTLLMSILLGMLDFKDIFFTHESNVSRRPTAVWWSEFVSSTDKLKLPYVKSSSLTFDEKLSWLQRQVAPTLALVANGYSSLEGSDYAFLQSLIRDGKSRMTEKQQYILDRYLEEEL